MSDNCNEFTEEEKNLIRKLTCL